MDDGGQRLLDVIEDTHVLETFLRENFSSSGLEDSPRFDNVSSSTDNGIVSGGLDSLVFDGQLVDPLRPTPNHSTHHPHQVGPHVLQQVLHPQNLPSGPSISGGSLHQLHPHQLSHHHHHHHQQHHFQQPDLQQHHTHQHQQQQIQPNHPSLHSPVTGSLDVDCIGRTREACSGGRNDSDHALQQLLASAGGPLTSSQQILQLHHHQSHQHAPHQLHPSVSQPHQIHTLQPHLVRHQGPVLPPPAFTPQLPSPGSVLQHHHSQPQNQHQQQHPQQPQQSSKAAQQHNHLAPPLSSQNNSDVSSNLLPLGLPSHTSIENSCNRLPNMQSPPLHQLNVSAAQESPSKLHVLASSSSTKIVATPSVVQAGSSSTSGRVQIVGGNNQVLCSTGQLLSPSQLLPGAQIVQQTGSTQMISGGSILAGNHVLSTSNVLPRGQVISGMQNSQVFSGSQLFPGTQVLANHLLNNSNVIATVAGIGATSTAPLYVTHTGAPQVQAPQQNLACIPSVHNISTSTVSLPLQASSATFTVPTKSPISSLPRTSPGPAYPATPSPHHPAHSPAAYPARSPVQSPHTMKSPITPASPGHASIPTATATIVTSSSNQTSQGALVSGVVGSVVQGMVPHLPLTQIGVSNGVVITQGGTPVQVAPNSNIKQMVQGGQLIQLVSPQPSNQPRPAVAMPHPKPIQPKPQLLPKPSPQGNVRQSTPPPPGKTLIGTRPTPPNTQSPIVIGTSGPPPTVIAGQQNLGSFVLNSSLLHTGLQQPILIPQPNGVQLLVRPAGPHSGTTAQTLLVPMPGQSQVVTNVGKVHQPQTLVIPGGGQTPALVIPQALASAFGGGSVITNTAPGSRTTQPFIRLLAPQAPFQLQQINTPSGPMLVAVPIGQTTLNIPGLFASNAVRTLTPQVATGALQLATPNLAPASGVNVNQIHIPPCSISTNTTNQGIHLTSSFPSTISSVITTSIATKPEDIISSTSSATSKVSLTSPTTPVVDVGKTKKKSKKKKKEKDSNDDKSKGRGISINLNELLKETGIVSEMIFDENDFGSLAIEESGSNFTGVTAVSTGQLSFSSPVASNQNTIFTKAATINSHNLTSSSHLNYPLSAVSLPQSQITIPSVISSVHNPSVSTLPTSMCFTLDAQGKLILGSTDGLKPTLTTITGSLPQVINSGGLTFNPSEGFTVGGGEGGTHVSPMKGNVASQMSHIVAIQPQMSPTIIDSNQLTSVIKADSIHIQNKSKSSCGNEIIKIGPNTQFLQTDKNNTITSGSLFSSLLNNSLPQMIGISCGNGEMASIPLSILSNEKAIIQNAVSTPHIVSTNQILSSPHTSQVPLNSPTVIVSSSLNSGFMASALLNGKSVIATTPNSEFYQIPQQTVDVNQATRLGNPVLFPIVDNCPKINTYQSEYIASVKSHNIIEPKVKKSSKKKKKEIDHGSAANILTDRSNKNGTSHSLNPILIHNGNIGGSLPNSKSEEMPKSESSGCVISPTYPHSLPLVTASPTTHTISSITSKNSKGALQFTGNGNSLSGLVVTNQQVVIQPGQQVKQLLLSPQNQEALKRVHNQIQELQNRKGSISERDKVLHQKLITEYKKIMATGTPVPVTPQPQQNVTSSSQHNPIKYSHSVGHKKIFFTPNQKKGGHSNQSSKKSYVDLKSNDNKNKDGELVIMRDASSATILSSHSLSGFFTTTVTQSSPTSLSASSGLHSSVGRSHQKSLKIVDKEVTQTGISLSSSVVSDMVGTSSSVTSIHSPTSSHGVPGMSMPILIPSPKSLMSPSLSKQRTPTPQSSPSTQQPSPNQLTHAVISPNNSTPVRGGFTIPLTRDHLFEHQLRTDQNGALYPDYQMPFKNKTDACKRLIRYHVYNEMGPTALEFNDSDCQFEVQSETLMRKFNSMLNKYKMLLLRDSMRRHPSSEMAMLYRLFIQEEKHNQEKERMDVKNGKDLCLPPVPSHWLTREPPPPPSTPYPWEEKWPNEKVFILKPRSPSPETPSEGKALFPEARTGTWSDSEGKQEDLEEEGLDEPRLQIFMGDDTDESGRRSRTDPPTDASNNVSEGETPKVEKSVVPQQYSKSCDSGSLDLPQNVVNNCVVVEEEPPKYIYISEGYSISVESPNGFTRQKKKSDENCTVTPPCNYKVENGIDGAYQIKADSSDYYIIKGQEKCPRRDIPPGYFYSQPLDPESNKNSDKFRHDKKSKVEKDRKKREKSRESVRDKNESRTSKRLKIKLKPNDNEGIPPLRIKSDEKLVVGSGSGGLKLTLKKQEGSGDYYRVGDDPKEYRVELNAHDCEVVENNTCEGVMSSGRQLRDLSVVLEDCLHINKREFEERSKRELEERNKRELEENKSNCRRNKRIKLHHNEYNLDLDPPPTQWVSSFVDPWGRADKHSVIHRPGFLVDRGRSSGPTPICIPPPTTPKIVPHSSRNSHRFS